MINEIKVREDRVDSWKWIYRSDGLYSVKVAYDFLTPNECFLDKKW